VPYIPSPLSALPGPRVSSKSTVDVGRVAVGVLDGVPLGVDCALLVPTRDFLDEERGVILLLRKALTGVERSSRGVALARGVLPGASPRSGRRVWPTLL
jgi:hypothetical protein